jgi:uncharacterized protein (DUF1697 family)
MTVRVVLLRGVNVAGAGKLPMAEFREMLGGLGLLRAETHIQSGNAVFVSDQPVPVLETAIRGAIAARFGFAPEVFVLGTEEIAAALTDHPFAAADPARVHVFFLKADPVLDEAALDRSALPGDAWVTGPCRLTLHSPAGIGRSKLAEKLAVLLPRPMTARNLRTVAALQAMTSRIRDAEGG